MNLEKVDLLYYSHALKRRGLFEIVEMTMAIYRYGSEITLCDARLVPVWIEHQAYATKWHYKKPNRVPKKSTIEEHPVWHYRGWYTESGNPIQDNKWVSANDLKADDGWKEIQAKLHELCPDGEEKFNQWNVKGAPEASHFFSPISEKEAA